ncbi:hypothetical protein PIROE2DRAFT_1088, partial [Piromyces sp. E2]
SSKDSASCTVRVSPLPNKLNEKKKERSNIKFDSVVTTKLSHESFDLHGPTYNKDCFSKKRRKTLHYMEHETPMNGNKAGSFKCLCSTVSICSSLKKLKFHQKGT